MKYETKVVHVLVKASFEATLQKFNPNFENTRSGGKITTSSNRCEITLDKYNH